MDQSKKDCAALKTYEDSSVLNFKDLSYTSPGKRGQTPKTILKSVNGTFYPGKLTAIIGPSGAGKSSLLNILSGIIKQGVTGDIRVNGEPRTLKSLRSQSCYIEQNIELLPFINVEETLRFAVDLKLDSRTSITIRKVLVNSIMDILELKNVSKTLTQNLSGGEKKRLSIGIELITNPPLMFFDEPTSGLDSVTSVQVINYLKTISKVNRTVVCVVHQPSSTIFNAFDDVFVMTEGKIVYGGPTNKIVSAFSKAHFECPEHFNPAEYVIEVVTNHPDLQLGLPQNNGYSNTWNISSTDSINMGHKKIYLAHTNKNTFHKNGSNYLNGIVHQCRILSKRNLIISKRNTNVIYARFLLCLLLGFLGGTFWYGIGNDADKVLSNLSMIFNMMFTSYAAMCLATLLYYPSEVRVVSREIMNRWYSIGAYYLSKIVMEIPLVIIFTSAVLFPMYYMSAQILEMQRVIMMWIILFLLMAIAETHGLVFGAVLPTQISMISILATAVVLTSMSGFPIRLNDIPSYARWFEEINYAKFSYEGFLRIIYGYNRTDLECNEPFCYFKSPRKILYETHITDTGIMLDVIGLCTWLLIYQILLYSGLKFKQQKYL